MEGMKTEEEHPVVHAVGQEGPTPRERFHEKMRAREARKKTPHEHQNRLKKKTNEGKQVRRRRTEFDHCASAELVAERFDSKQRFECWRCDEPKESRILYKWHIGTDEDEPAQHADDGAAEQRAAAAQAAEGEEALLGEDAAPPEDAATSVKTICLGCYGHLLSLRKGRDAPPAGREVQQQQRGEVGGGGQQHTPQRGGHGAGVAVDPTDTAPTRLAPHPHKRREKKHARVSYVVPKGMRGGGRGGAAPSTRGGGRGGGQQQPSAT